MVRKKMGKMVDGRGTGGRGDERAIRAMRCTVRRFAHSSRNQGIYLKYQQNFCHPPSLLDQG